ncbi:MAG: hypothetical protein CBE14_002310 [Rickettsiales bacterium TMED254]|nr:hypothetical protein [Rickettsiales bacterium]RPF76426.1 MAG: hypothetical protein CBE14_002310 [Rickettsiales bacterium TMED254]
MKKKLKLITHNSSWWKSIKYRKLSAKILKKHKKLGWKLLFKKAIINNKQTVDTRSFHYYYLIK